MEKVQIDKWLWARMFKTRSMASDACAGGHVKLNDETVKANKSVMIGDTVDVLTPGGPRVLEVAGLADKRGPAKVAVAAYVDPAPPPPPTGPMAGDPVTFDRGSRRGRKGARPTRGTAAGSTQTKLVRRSISSNAVTSPAASARASLRNAMGHEASDNLAHQGTELEAMTGEAVINTAQVDGVDDEGFLLLNRVEAGLEQPERVLVQSGEAPGDLEECCALGR